MKEHGIVVLAILPLILVAMAILPVNIKKTPPSQIKPSNWSETLSWSGQGAHSFDHSNPTSTDATSLNYRHVFSITSFRVRTQIAPGGELDDGCQPYWSTIKGADNGAIDDDDTINFLDGNHYNFHFTDDAGSGWSDDTDKDEWEKITQTLPSDLTYSVYDGIIHVDVNFYWHVLDGTSAQFAIYVKVNSDEQQVFSYDNYHNPNPDTSGWVDWTHDFTGIYSTSNLYLEFRVYAYILDHNNPIHDGYTGPVLDVDLHWFRVFANIQPDPCDYNLLYFSPAHTWTSHDQNGGTVEISGSGGPVTYTFTINTGSYTWSYPDVKTVADPEYSAESSLSMAINHRPLLTEGSVTPLSGTIYTTFTYKVKYTDPDGDQPLYVHVVIDGNEYAMNYESGSYTDGAWYSFSLSGLNRTVSHAFYFKCDDGNEGGYRETESYSGPMVNNQQPQLLDPTVSPKNGTSLDTYLFTVRYKDADNDAPTHAWLYINGSQYIMVGKPDDGDYTNGRDYSYSLTLPDGYYEFYYDFSDGIDTVATPVDHFVVDSVLPVYSSYSPANGTLIGTAHPTFWVYLTDNLAGVNPDYMYIYINGTLVDLSTVSRTVNGKNVNVSYTFGYNVNGQVDVRIKFYDYSGNEGEIEWYFDVDSLPPKVTDYSPIITANTDVSVHVHLEDQYSNIPDTTVEMYCNGTPIGLSFTAGPRSLDVDGLLTNPSEGRMNITVVYADSFGHGGSFTWNLIIDRSAPYIDISRSVYNNTYDHVVAVEMAWYLQDLYSGIDASSVIVKIDNEYRPYYMAPPWINFTQNYSIYLPSGYHNITIFARDHAGNNMTWIYMFLVHNMPPYVKSYSPMNGSWLNNDGINIQLEFADYGVGINSDTIFVFLDGVNITGNASIEYDAYNGIAWISLAEIGEGSHVIFVEFNDTAENPYTGNITLVINVDRTPPLPPRDVSVEYNKVDGSVIITWAPSESNDVVGYEIYRKTDSGGYVFLGKVTSTKYIDKQVMPGESYEYKVVVIDLAGNEACVTVSYAVPTVEVIPGIPLEELLLLMAVIIGALGAGSVIVLKHRMRKESELPEIPEERDTEMELTIGPEEEMPRMVALPAESEVVGSAYIYGTDDIIDALSRELQENGIPCVRASVDELDMVIMGTKIGLLHNPATGEVMVLYAPMYAEAASRIAEGYIQRGRAAFAHSVDDGAGDFEFAEGVFITNIMPGCEEKIIQLLTGLF